MKKHTTFLFLMKQRLTLLPMVWVLILGLITIVPSIAQTPQFFYTPPGTTVANNIPTGSATNKRQCVYYKTDFGTTGPGMITKLYIKISAVASATYTDFTIKLGTAPTTYTTFTSATQAWLATDTVFYAPSIVLTTNSGNWYEITLTKPFYYDNVSNLVYEFSQNGYTTSYSGFYASSLVTARSIYGLRTSATASTLNDRLWQIGFDLSPVRGANNASISQLISPVSFCAGSQNVAVRLKNKGNNLINNVTIQWKLDNVLQTPVTWTSPLDTVGSLLYPSDTAITLGTGIPFTGARTLKVWTELPNGVADTVNIDDTLLVTAAPALSGSYVIGGTGAPFATLNDAVNALNNYGVCGPVTLNVTPGSGPYATNLSFGNIQGTSAINTVTINGNGNTITSATSPLVAFSGTSYLTLDSFNITGSGAFAGCGVYFANQSHHITLNRNKIDVGITATAVANSGIAVAGLSATPTTAGTNGRFLTITNNEVIGGYYGIVMVGSGTYLDNGRHTIQNNKIKDFYSYGIYMANADTLLISNNDISRPTRTAVTTTYGIHLISSRNAKIFNNKVHDLAVASYTCYPLNFVGCVNTTGLETQVWNNLMYNIGTTAVMHGINFLTTASAGFNIYYNTIQHDVPSISASIIRGISLGVASITNVNIKNNIISIKGAGTTGVKTGIYVTTAGPTIISNNNVIHVNTATASLNNVGYWTAARVTLADWRTASSQDLASVSSDPVFANVSIGNMIPVSLNCDNIGAPLAGITTDFSGASRSATTPDPGAYEFTGIAGDIAMIKGELKRSSICYSTNDTLRITIKNLIGAMVDYSLNPLKIVWKTTGPVITRDSFMVTSGTLNPDSSQTFLATNVNMSALGTYTLNAYIVPNAVNASAVNDTLLSLDFVVKSLLEVTPKTITVTGPADTVILFAQSPLFPRGPFFSEISHFKTTVGQPTTGWPTYLIADDYVEITGVPNSDLAGYVMEDWGTTPTHIVTFPTGTLFSPNGTLILATGQLTTSLPVPASFYYHTGNAGTHSSTTAGGYILKNAVGTVIDAVSYGTFAFPASTGVTAADWTGSTTAANSGIRLNGADNNTSSTWINSTTAPQDPNALNSGVTAPPPGTFAGFDWNYLGGSIGTSPKKVVGPYSVPGVYTYVASYTNICGTFYDTVKVTAAATVPVKLVSFKASRANADVNLVWNTASETNNSHFEIERSVNGKDFTAIGRVKGTGTASKANRYAYVDARAANTAARALYYRLKQVDNNGASTYSRTEVVTLSNKQITGLGTHPNPSNGMFTITADLASASTVNLKVVNIMGATVWNQTMTPVMGANAFDANLQLPDGVYMLVLEQDGETSTQKFVLQK